MPQPTPYERAYDLADVFAPGGAQVDIELDRVKTSLDETQANLALIQRDDGALCNAIVTPESFSRSALYLMTTWNPRGAWATLTVYERLDFVSFEGRTYVALIQHDSTTFAADIAQNRWMPFDVMAPEVPTAPLVITDPAYQLTSADHGRILHYHSASQANWTIAATLASGTQIIIVATSTGMVVLSPEGTATMRTSLDTEDDKYNATSQVDATIYLLCLSNGDLVSAEILLSGQLQVLP